MSSPRPWGCFLKIVLAFCFICVFPTPVGVFPDRGNVSSQMQSLPHARGGVSISQSLYGLPIQSSPRPWGCFCYRPLLNIALAVFPTPVGVFPDPPKNENSAESLPHARGGVSVSSSSCIELVTSSPRPWGCFWRKGNASRATAVFPTPVGVFLI